ncbi:MAG: glucose-6-phosphate isomerase [Deltaproteobacteria bacterium]|nr:glucose-6-phosphate isomerase [Deltaproteobacteria bacterium]
MKRIIETNAWPVLIDHAKRMGLAENHLQNLIAAPGRFDAFSMKAGPFLYDFSRQRVDTAVMNSLYDLAREQKLPSRFKEMMSGSRVNVTEKRSALHTASRNFSNEPVLIDGRDVMPENTHVRKQIKAFSQKIHSGELRGSTGKRFSSVVAVGIGGSYLGPEFVATALKGGADKGIRLHFLSNVDIDCFGAIVPLIDLEATLWIIISKSYTTTETMANANQVIAFVSGLGLSPEKHIVTVTSKGSPGDDSANPVLASFHMFDYIGGRYSVTSAVGGVPLSLFLGYDRFESFLKGAAEMDIHAASAAPEKNAPLTAALIGIWNNNFLGYPAQGLIPYSSALSRFPAHVQQLYMESNGKSVTSDGQPTGADTGMIIFGEPGTNAQHSFFQLAHQGRPFPIDFIGVIHPHYRQYKNRSKGVTNHQELWANFIAQPQALACGRDNADEPARNFSGNRPSSTIVIEDLSPENIGRLLSFYEARTVFEAFVWDINPFDQFGVELGKTMAGGIRAEIAAANEDPGHLFDDRDQIQKAYLEMLFSGNL